MMRLLETSEAFLLQKKILSYCLFAPPIYIVFLHAHPVRGESHNYPNATGEVATTYNDQTTFHFSSLRPAQDESAFHLKKYLITLVQTHFFAFSCIAFIIVPA